MTTLPPPIRSLKIGSETTMSSMTMAILRPTFSPDMFSNASAPMRSKLTLTCGVPVSALKPTVALTMRSPVRSARDLMM